MTLAAIERNYQKTLASLYPVGEIRQLFLMTLEKLASISPSQYPGRRDEFANDVLIDTMEGILESLRRGQPIQHILGEAYFYGMTLIASKDALIPRPETEELVHLILQNHRQTDCLTVMDVGTGTGCIAIALAKNLSSPQVWAMDVSAVALDIARMNAKLQEQPVHFIQGDILEWEMIFSEEQRFDIIVSNPPYITPKEKETMHHNVLHYEPHLALFVEEESPLLFYDYIADFALSHLTVDGTLYFEINQYLGRETAEMLRKKGFKDVHVLKDINDVDRMVLAKRN